MPATADDYHERYNPGVIVDIHISRIPLRKTACAPSIPSRLSTVRAIYSGC